MIVTAHPLASEAGRGDARPGRQRRRRHGGGAVRPQSRRAAILRHRRRRLPAALGRRGARAADDRRPRDGTRRCHARNCSFGRTASRWISRRRCRAAARSACRARWPFWSWRTGCTAVCRGPSWSRPAIELAEAGFPISPRLAAAIAESAEGLAAFPVTRAYFLDEAGRPRQAGSTCANPAFAATLRPIAAEGSDPFYRGEIASGIVAAVRRRRPIRAR